MLSTETAWSLRLNSEVIKLVQHIFFVFGNLNIPTQKMYICWTLAANQQCLI